MNILLIEYSNNNGIGKIFEIGGSLWLSAIHVNIFIYKYIYFIYFIYLVGCFCMRLYDNAAHDYFYFTDWYKNIYKINIH